MWADRGENLAEARQFIERALEIEPDNPAYLDSLAWVLFKQGAHAQALEHQLRALKLTPEPDATLLDHLGDIYAALGRLAEARAAWQKSLEVEANPEVEKKLDPQPPAPASP
jgi:tetratricopeptide (TPR) repeat protein